MNSVDRCRERARALYGPVTWTQAPRTVKATRPESETPKSSAGTMNAVGPPVSGQDAVVILAANALFEHDRLGRGRLGPRIMMEERLDLYCQPRSAEPDDSVSGLAAGRRVEPATHRGVAAGVD